MNTRPPSDSLLIERCQRGDAQAIDELLRKHSETAFRYALSLTKNLEEAADVVSETFIRVSRGIHRYQTRSSFTTWMFTILRRCFYDYCIKQKRLGQIYSLDTAQEQETGVVFKDLIDRSESPYALAVKADFSDEVRHLVAALPGKQRTVLQMHFDDHLSLKQISGILGIPEGTLRSRLHRARQSLRGWARDGVPESTSDAAARSVWTGRSLSVSGAESTR